METSQYLHSLPLMDYNQSNMLFPPNYDFHDLPLITGIRDDDDAYMDTLFGASEEPPQLHHGDTFVGIEEALLADSPQQERTISASPGGGDRLNLSKLSSSDLLLVGAEAVESENWHLASATLAQLDQTVLGADTATDASPFLRLACFFAQGLRLRALGPWLPAPAAAAVPVSPPVPPAADSMSPYQMVQELSPYVKFAHFTANQAILEASAGHRELHVVDFDVMEGLQWPPLMVDLARRSDADVSLRITAVVADRSDASEVRRTGRRLVEFAGSIGLALKFDHLHEASLDELEPSRGPAVIANCVVHQLRAPSKSFASARKFISAVRKLSPKVVVLVQEELFNAAAKARTTTVSSFVEFFCEALGHFSSVSESLASSFGGGYEGGLRLVEKEMLGPRIVDYVSRFFPPPPPCGGSLGLEEEEEEGFRMVPLSPCNVSQAKFLVGLFSRGYGLQHSKHRLALCWNSRPLITASIWVPISK